MKGDMPVLAEMCSEEVSTRDNRRKMCIYINPFAQLFKKLAHDWKKLRAIGIETNCEVKSKSKPKVDSITLVTMHTNKYFS